MKKSRTQKGITLIALIITIVVLLILAVVAIGAVQNDGIIQYAKNARSDYEAAKDNEKGILDGYIAELNDALPEGNQGGKTGGEQEGEQGGSSSGDQTGTTLASQITAANYGDTITYSAGGITDWKIFYKDENNVYIIASKCQVTANADAGLAFDEVMGNYHWLTIPEYQEVTSTVVSKFKAEYGDYSTNTNGKCVSRLLNTSNWSEYASGIDGAEAIGGPTLEMFVASYNEKSAVMTNKNYGTLAFSKDGAGYKVSLNGGELTNDRISFSDVAASDSLYFGPKSEDGLWYWLASPGSKGSNTEYICAIGKYYSSSSNWIAGYIEQVDFTGDAGRLMLSRPVVCLPNGVTAEQDANGT